MPCLFEIQFPNVWCTNLDKIRSQPGTWRKPIAELEKQILELTAPTSRLNITRNIISAISRSVARWTKDAASFEKSVQHE